MQDESKKIDETEQTEQGPKASELSDKDLDRVAGGLMKLIDKASPKLYP